MDNTSKDNKSRIALAMAQSLVHLGMFRSVRLGFLPVGHTHEDIDACFSVIAQRLKYDPAYSLPQLLRTCQEAFTDMNVYARVMDRHDVIDFRDWLGITK